MSRITKDIAKATAISLLSAKKDKIKELKNQLKEMVTKVVQSTIPNSVMKLFAENPRYFNTHINTRFNCAGFNYEYYEFNRLPDNGDNPVIGTQEGDKILNLTNKIEKLEGEYRTLKNEIEVALFAFRTYANVEKEFPEAFVLLPTRVSQALIININAIREKIA